MANGFIGGKNGDIDVKRDIKTPAEVSRKETGGWVMDFKIPLAMAAVLGIGSMFLFWAGMWAIRALGRGGFWFIAAIMAGAHLCYIIWMTAKYDNDTITRTVFTGFFVSLLTGWFALALDRVLFLYALQAAQIAPFVGLLVFLAMIAARFVQELALFGSPFVEKAIGDIASQEKPPWYAGRVQRPPTSLPKPIPQFGRPTAARAAPPDNGRESARVSGGDNNDVVASAASASSISNGIFEAPSGYIRTRQDLAEFVQIVGSGVKDPQLGAWESKVQGRDYGWWGDMVDTSALFGLVTPREGGTKVRVLRQDWQVILREIEQGLD